MNAVLLCVLVLGTSLAGAERILAVSCPPEDDPGAAIYFPHETDCGRFYECDAGKARLMECPPGLYWDSRLNTCNWNVDCGDLKTSPPPPPTTSTAPTTPDA